MNTDEIVNKINAGVNLEGKNLQEVRDTLYEGFKFFTSNIRTITIDMRLDMYYSFIQYMVYPYVTALLEFTQNATEDSDELRMFAAEIIILLRGAAGRNTNALPKRVNFLEKTSVCDFPILSQAASLYLTKAEIKDLTVVLPQRFGSIYIAFMGKDDFGKLAKADPQRALNLIEEMAYYLKQVKFTLKISNQQEEILTAFFTG